MASNYRTVQLPPEVMQMVEAIALHSVGGKTTIAPSPAKTVEMLAADYIKHNSVQLQA